MLRLLFLCVLIQACYKVTYPEGEQPHPAGAFADHPIAGAVETFGASPTSADSEPVAGVSVWAPPDSGLAMAGANGGVDIGGPPPSSERDQRYGQPRLPILYRAEPSWSCSNRDMLITLHGANIRWESTVRIVYPYSAAVLDITHADVDECGGSPLSWKDVDEFQFITRQEVAWEGMGDYVSGYYLVSVVGPTGESNQVGMNLQWCDDVEAAAAGTEVTGCW